MAAMTITADELDRAVGQLGELSLLDKRLLKMASQGYTPEGMSDALRGVLTPAKAAQRVREILKSYDWLSIVERRALILMDMIELKEILLDRVRREGGVVEDRDGRVAYSFGDPRWAANLAKVLSEMNKLISDESGRVEADRAAIRREHAQIMVRAIEQGFMHLLRLLQASYPEIDEQHARYALEDSLPIAITTVDGAVDEEDRLMDEDEAGGF